MSSPWLTNCAGRQPDQKRPVPITKGRKNTANSSTSVPRAGLVAGSVDRFEYIARIPSGGPSNVKDKPEHDGRRSKCPPLNGITQVGLDSFIGTWPLADEAACRAFGIELDDDWLDRKTDCFAVAIQIEVLPDTLPLA